MFKLFQRKPRVYAQALLNDEQIKARAKAMAEKMGDRLCTATNSVFKFEPGHSAVLKGTLPGQSRKLF